MGPETFTALKQTVVFGRVIKCSVESGHHLFGGTAACILIRELATQIYGSKRSSVKLIKICENIKSRDLQRPHFKYPFDPCQFCILGIYLKML
jgi:hypothetical protein